MKALKNKNKRFLGLCCLAGMIPLGLLSMKAQQVPMEELQCQRLVIKSPDGLASLILDASTSIPTIKFLDKKGQPQLELSSAESGAIKIKNKKGADVFILSLDKDEAPTLLMKDQNQLTRMQIQGGDSPSIFIRNRQNEVVATMLLLQDGGAAVGLADKEGDVAAFMRGGVSPSLSFYQKSIEPMAAVGISQQVPHLLITSPATKDNLVLHGGDPTSVLFVDDKGDVPILLSKNGLFQGKKEPSPTKEQKDDKIFTLEDFINPLKNKKLNER